MIKVTEKAMAELCDKLSINEVEAIDKDTKQICIECMCCHELCMFKAVELKNENMVAGLISGFFRK